MGKLRPKICKQCSKPFRGVAKRVYCSDACKYRYKYPPRAGGTIKYGRTCAEREKTYDGNRTKYCSDECFAIVCVRSKGSLARLKKEEVLLAKCKPCMDCGERFPAYVMDLHHRDPSQKDFALSHHRGASIERIRDEIDKCDLLCANCHRMRHLG